MYLSDNIVKSLELARGNRAVKHLEKDQHHRPQVSPPPPSTSQQPPVSHVQFVLLPTKLAYVFK